MRILIVSEVFYPEDFMVNELAVEWQRMGHQVEVLSQYPSYPQSYVFDGYENRGRHIEEWNGIRIHRFPVIEGYRDSKMRKFANYLRFVKEGKSIARQIGKDFDVVFVSQTGPLTVALPALAARKKWGVPVAILILDIWPDVVWTYGVPKLKPIEWLLDKLIKRIYSRCDKILVSSKRFASTINHYTNQECIYAPNWLRRVEEVDSTLRLGTGKFHFTFTGNISRYQNLENTIRGFVKADIKDAVLNIVGDGSYAEQVRAVIQELGTVNVVMHGRRPYNEMGDIMRQSDVLLLPLIDNEGIMKTEPLKLQSYLDAGKPVLGILNGSGRDIIEESNIGICAQPSNIEDIARGFQSAMVFAKEHSEEVKANAMKLMLDRFNKERIVNLITENLEEIAKRTKS